MKAADTCWMCWKLKSVRLSKLLVNDREQNRCPFSFGMKEWFPNWTTSASCEHQWMYFWQPHHLVFITQQSASGWIRLSSRNWLLIQCWDSVVDGFQIPFMLESGESEEKRKNMKHPLSFECAKNWSQPTESNR